MCNTLDLFVSLFGGKKKGAKILKQFLKLARLDADKSGFRINYKTWVFKYQ